MKEGLKLATMSLEVSLCHQMQLKNIYFKAVIKNVELLYVEAGKGLPTEHLKVLLADTVTICSIWHLCLSLFSLPCQSAIAAIKNRISKSFALVSQLSI